MSWGWLCQDIDSSFIMWSGNHDILINKLDVDLFCAWFKMGDKAGTIGVVARVGLPQQKLLHYDRVWHLRHAESSHATINYPNVCSSVNV